MLSSILVSPTEVALVLIAIVGFFLTIYGDNAVSRVFKGKGAAAITQVSANAAVALGVRIDQLEKQVASLQAENVLLKELVTHSGKIDALTEELQGLRGEVQEWTKK